MSIFGWRSPQDVERRLLERFNSFERRFDVRAATDDIWRASVDMRLDKINGGFGHHEERLRTIEEAHVHLDGHDEGVAEERRRWLSVAAGVKKAAPWVLTASAGAYAAFEKLIQ